MRRCDFTRLLLRKRRGVGSARLESAGRCQALCRDGAPTALPKPYDRQMADRGWQNVWAHIVSEAWAHRLSGEPIATLDREIPNVIVQVTPSMIRRRSA